MSKVYIENGWFPKSCSDCELKYSDHSHPFGSSECIFGHDIEGEYGSVKNEYNSLHGGGRHSECPLREEDIN